MGSYIENGSSLVDTYRLISTMYQIGQWWQENKISVADEHLATATCDYIIARLQFTVNKEKLPSKRALLFLCRRRRTLYWPENVGIFA